MNGCPPLNFINLQEVYLPEDQFVGTIMDNLPIKFLPDEVWVHIFAIPINLKSLHSDFPVESL